ncbi:MAG: 3-coathanger stack domain-containing protein [Bacteroidota bacterium]
MKNVCLYIGLLVLLCTQGFSQGTDVIFLIDNSGSITGSIGSTGPTGSEYNLMYNSIQSIMNEVLNCNSSNKIAIVQYSANGNPRIYIESDFSNTTSTFNRRYGDNGNISGAINLVSKALNGTPASGTIDGLLTLNRTPGNALAVFLFTDAPRNNDLLSNSVLPPNNNVGFSAFTNFKNNEDAKFIVVNTDIGAATIAASAGVASLGGSWTGTIEAYSTDPDGSATPPRRFINTSFSLTALQIEIVTDFICSVGEPECVQVLTLSTLADNDVASGQDNRQAEFTISASNVINNGAVGVYHAGNEVVLTSGFHSASGSRFRGYIEGCSGNFVGRVGQFDQEEPILSNKELSLFSLAPNPANSIVTLTATQEMKLVTITSQDGKTLYDRAMPNNTTTLDVAISNYSNGIYTVTLVTTNGQIQTQKLVKN